MYLLDTNIFLEILLDQERAKECLEFVETLDAKHEGFLSAFSLHAIEAIIGRTRNAKLLVRFLQTIGRHPYIHRIITTIEEETAIAHLMPKTHLDFDDTLQYYVVQKNNLTLVTLDKDFDRIKDVPVIRPY